VTRKVNDISDITDIDSIAKDFVSIIMSRRNRCIIILLLTASYAGRRPALGCTGPVRAGRRPALGACRDAVKWLTEAFNKDYKAKVSADTAAAPEVEGRTPNGLKRRKVSAAGFMDSDSDLDPDEAPTVQDELIEYLAIACHR
jgi:hypothetical protein